MMNWNSLALVLFSAVLNAAGQLLLKMSVNNAQFQRWQDYFVEGLSDKWLLFSLALVMGSFAVWVVGLGKLDLGVAMSAFALTYVLVVVGGVLFFNEPVTPMRVMGMLLIVGGVFAVAGSR